MDTLYSFINVLLVLGLVALNGFFVAVEFAIVRSRITKLRSPDWSNKFGVKTSIELIERLDDSLSATQLGITIASLLLGWWGEHTFATLLEDSFSMFSPEWQAVLTHVVATAAALVIITFLHVVLGEMVAKSVAIRYPERTLLYCAVPMSVFTKVFRPILTVLVFSSNLCLRPFGMRSVAESEHVHSPEELQMLVSHSTEEGFIDLEEEQMLRGVFEFSKTVAREVMTPRTDVISIKANASLDDVVGRFLDSGFSRLPVIEKRIDDIVGIVLIRDVMRYIANGDDKTKFRLADIVREPYYVPGTKPIDDLLAEFKLRKLHLAIVLDEHGGMDGIVSLEDIIEEIVGDIFDESDIAEHEIEHVSDTECIIDGGVLVTDINDRFSLELPIGDYDTIAGFVLTAFGRLPELGDSFSASYVIEDRDSKRDLQMEADNASAEPLSFTFSIPDRIGGDEDLAQQLLHSTVTFTVEEIADRRIEKVRIKRQFDQQYLETTTDSSASNTQEQKDRKEA